MWWPDIRDEGWDPFDEMRRLQREVNRLFNGYGPQTGEIPALNVYSKEDDVMVTAELPGVNAEKLDISVQGNVCTIQGTKDAEDKAEDVVCHRLERSSGSFSRSFRLPFEVQEDQVKASLDKGILTLHLPRAEASKPKKIEINAS